MCATVDSQCLEYLGYITLGRALNFLKVSYTATPLGFGCCLGTEFRSEMVSPGSACNFDGASHLDTVYDLPNFCFILAKA